MEEKVLYTNDLRKFHCRKVKMDNPKVGDIFSFEKYTKSYSPNSIYMNTDLLKKVVAINNEDGGTLKYCFLENEKKIYKSNSWFLKCFYSSYCYVYNRSRKEVKKYEKWDFNKIS